MRWLGEYLAGLGHTVLGIRLAGHATLVEDMKRSHWQDWLACVEDGYQLLSGFSDRIFLIGLSLGGVLSLTFASGRHSPSPSLAGLIVLATPYSMPLNPMLERLIKPLSLFMPYRAKGPGDWHDQAALQEHICYPVDPTRAGVELSSLLPEMRAGLPLVNCPVLMIYSKDDATVTPEAGHADKIYQALGSQQKDLIWIEGSGHNITCDLQRQSVFEFIANFIAQENIKTA
jgi:carboxylesterase